MIDRLARKLVLRPGRVLETYPALRIGNYLYFALRAHVEMRSGRKLQVLDSGLDPAWLEALPLLRPLLVSPRQARWRRVVYIPRSFYQDYGVDFTAADLDYFVRAVILPSLPTAGDADDLVVNVRRGDYYSEPHFRAIYSFDIGDYVGRAINAASSSTGRPASIAVVSDDPEWCRQHLDWLDEHTDRLTFSPVNAVDNFAQIASARRLVLTNSTFSYWGGYISQLRHGHSHGGVWVPALHQRDVNGGRAWQHDPRWHALEVDR